MMTNKIENALGVAISEDVLDKLLLTVHTSQRKYGEGHLGEIRRLTGLLATAMRVRWPKRTWWSLWLVKR
uniref:Uncharacterized protein n=1 Tax=viral metagenome TaxID=1070528 RepID=A0A6M3JGW3_9ZZZZ